VTPRQEARLINELLMGRLASPGPGAKAAEKAAVERVNNWLEQKCFRYRFACLVETGHEPHVLPPINVTNEMLDEELDH